MMLLDFLSCQRCRKPFHADFGKSRTPVADKDWEICCQKCAKGAKIPLKYVIDLLRQPGLLRLSRGWVIVGPLVPFGCPDCNRVFGPEPHTIYWQIIRHQQPTRCFRPAAKGVECVQAYCCRERPMTTWIQCDSTILPADTCVKTETNIITQFNDVVAHKMVILEMMQKKVKMRASCARCRERFGNGLVILGGNMAMCKKCDEEVEANEKCVNCSELPAEHRLRCEEIPGRRLREEIYAAQRLDVKAQALALLNDPLEACSGCEARILIPLMFSCYDCQGAVFCAVCSVRSHKTHKLLDFGAKKLTELEAQNTDDLTKRQTRIVSNFYDVHRLLADNMYKFFVETEQYLKLISQQHVYENGAAIGEVLCQKAHALEKHFEEYLPNARLCGEQLLDLADDRRALLRGISPGISKL